MTDQIKLETADRVLTLRINRPDKKNAFTQAMYATATETVNKAAADPQIRTLLIAGVPGAFSSGNDMQDFLQRPPTGGDAPIVRFMHAMVNFPKPVVAAVNGLAIGIGATVLLHTDLVYAGESSRFQMPFVNIGLCPEFASAYVLPRLMGHARAAELLMLGEMFGAAQAREYGLVNAVLPDADVETHALERARKLAQQPPAALRLTKRLLKRWTEATVTEAIEVEIGHFGPLLSQPEALEALNAFAQKRKPDFSKF